jgi:hypothetical protein
MLYFLTLSIILFFCFKQYKVSDTEFCPVLPLKCCFKLKKQDGVLNKNMRMGNIQKYNNFINKPPPQAFRSYLH